MNKNLLISLEIFSKDKFSVQELEKQLKIKNIDITHNELTEILQLYVKIGLLNESGFYYEIGL